MTRVHGPMAKRLLDRAHRLPILGNSQGVAIVVALLVLLVLTLIGISAISTTTYETNIAGNERLYNRSFYVADSGVDYFCATNNSYISVPNSTGTINSLAQGLSLNGDRFVITWERLRVDTGPPLKAEFKIISEGIAPNIPTAGRVRIETVIDGIDMGSSTIDPQGGNT